MHKFMKTLGIILVTSIVLTGCGPKDVNESNQKGDQKMGASNNIQEAAKDTEQKATTVLKTDLDAHDEELFEVADGWTNGNMFDCTWRKDNVNFENGIMKLTINTDGENASPKYSGGEYRTRGFYSYGLYEVRMKPIKNDGVVSSFFTYTGPSDNNPWDEIDIEFLGKDTTKVQFNYFTNGIGNHEYLHDLGFDASEDFHTYGFEWLPGSITWYVDGEPVYTAAENIPVTPAKVMMNVWPGTGVDGWLNAFDGKVPLTAEYDWIRVTQYDRSE
ncbi:beta-glucanase [Defluviitalea raffinosedens]|nr:glycoside hydrolase family 16 protein [Defluviitalea raffinosedens]